MGSEGGAESGVGCGVGGGGWSEGGTEVLVEVGRRLGWGKGGEIGFNLRHEYKTLRELTTVDTIFD